MRKELQITILVQTKGSVKMQIITITMVRRKMILKMKMRSTKRTMMTTGAKVNKPDCEEEDRGDHEDEVEDEEADEEKEDDEDEGEYEDEDVDAGSGEDAQ